MQATGSETSHATEALVPQALVPPPPQPRPRPGKHPSPSGLAAVSAAVRSFLNDEFQAREVRVTRIAALSGIDAGWEVDAEILVTDLAIKTLGLPLTQEVLERRRYAVQLDQFLALKGYEPLD